MEKVLKNNCMLRFVMENIKFLPDDRMDRRNELTYCLRIYRRQIEKFVPENIYIFSNGDWMRNGRIFNNKNKNYRQIITIKGTRINIYTLMWVGFIFNNLEEYEKKYVLELLHRDIPVVIDHRDNVKTNNAAYNLQLLTQSENISKNPRGNFEYIMNDKLKITSPREELNKFMEEFRQYIKENNLHRVKPSGKYEGLTLIEKYFKDNDGNIYKLDFNKNNNYYRRTLRKVPIQENNKIYAHFKETPLNKNGKKQNNKINIKYFV